MAIIFDIKKVETEILKKILEACEKSFPKELSLENFYGEGQTTWAIPEIGLTYTDTTSKDTLLYFVETLTDTSNIRLAYSTIYKEVESRKITPKEAPRPENQEKTTLNKDESENLVQKAEKRETQKKEATSKTDKEVEDFLKRKQEIIDQQKIDNIKKVVVVPTEEIHTVTLSEKEREELFNLKQAVNNDPATVQKIIEEKITQSVNTSQNPEIINSVTPEVVSKTAYSITQNVASLPNYSSVSEIPTVIPVLNPSSPLVTISDINNERLRKIIPDDKIRQIIVERAQIVAMALEAERSVNIAGANAVLGSENITSIFYGDDNITQFQIAENQESQRDEGIEIDPIGIYEQGKKISKVWEKLITRTATVEEVAIPASTFIVPYAPAVDTTLVVKSSSLALKALPIAGAVFGFKQGALISHWARSGPSFQVALSAGSQRFFKMLTSGPRDLAISSSKVLMSEPTQLVLGKFAIGFQTGATIEGHQVAIASASFGKKFTGFMGIKGGTQAMVGKISSQAGAKVAVGASKFLTKALTFLGGLSSWATMGLSLIASWVLGKIIEKINWKKVKENFLPVLAVGTGVLVGGPVGLGLLVGGGLMASGALRGGFKIGSFFARMGTVLGGIAITIATPVIVILLILPPTVAFFMFVINSGAYIVPPGASTFSNITNPYLEVTKSPVPPGPFKNSELPLTVEYKITIKAKKSVLQNIHISYECTVVKDGSKIDCPPIDPTIPSAIEDVSPTESYSFSYKQEYSEESFKDSLIMDVITVTADTDDQKDIKSNASAGVKIGNPPDDCPSIWPVNGTHMITQTPGGGFSHRGMEAIDIGELPVGSIVKATHSGIATVYDTPGGYGRHVRIISNCGGKSITTIYGHLIGFSISNGNVVLGQTIGASGSTGYSDAPHLHYEFTGGLLMVPPFIPKNITRNCSNITGLCGYIP